MSPTCSHAASAGYPAPPAKLECDECVKTGGRWVHLRQCLTCGHVGCCDSSPGLHARQHADRSHHPVIKSAEPGEDWKWCYVDNIYV